MKKSLCLAAGLLAFTGAPVFGQPAPVPSGSPATFSQRLAAIQQPQPSPDLAKFNLDFPGGTPKELVAAIEKAGGKPVNVIINKDDENAQLPPIKASEVDVPNLFKTLSENSKKFDANGAIVRNYGFQTIDQRPADNSLWTFYSYTKPNQQTQFSLDFPGGTPAQLVKAIEKAMHKSLNVIINKEDENIELPVLKMDDVYLQQLFTALGAASRKTIAGIGGNPFQTVDDGYGFKCADGSVSDNSVWYFHVEKRSQPAVVSPQKGVQFYSLAPFLDRGFTVDDITTAIQTGWKMADVTPTPELNYHKETKLLIAYGEPDKLQTIRNVLNTLPPSNATRNEVDDLNRNVRDLQTEVKNLKVKMAPPPSMPPAGSPAEKSGK